MGEKDGRDGTVEASEQDPFLRAGALHMQLLAVADEEERRAVIAATDEAVLISRDRRRSELAVVAGHVHEVQRGR